MNDVIMNDERSESAPSAARTWREWRPGLRWKLMLLLAVISASTAAAVGLVSYDSLQARLQTEIDRSLVQAADRFLEGPNGLRRFRIGGRLTVIVPDRPLGIEQYVVQVASIEGEVIASTSGVTLPTVTPSDPSWKRLGAQSALVRTVTSDQGDRYRVRAVVVVVPGTEFVLQLGRDFSETDNVLADLRTRIFLIGAGVSVVAALLGAAISSGVTSRLRRLSRVAERIGETGELTVDLPLEGNDETGRLARSFRDMVGALDESRSQQQRLVQDAGHELRTPLTSLRTNIDVLRRHENLSVDMRSQILADLDHDITELANLVDEIVTVASSRGVQPGESESIESLDLGELVTGVVDRFRRRFDREIRVDVDHSRVLARRTSIERAVSNVLDNALKFDEGVGPIDVSVESGTFVVLDRGPGIPESDLNAVFDRFHRSAEARSLPGSGLGLSIVADAVRDHAGGYFARRREGGGTEVGFWLPMAPD